jgi:hypothetical protein
VVTVSVFAHPTAANASSAVNPSHENITKRVETIVAPMSSERLVIVFSLRDRRHRPVHVTRFVAASGKRHSV